jgi:hypothetical protein
MMTPSDQYRARSDLLDIAKKASNLLPYGAWMLKDGGIVLFGRGHRALFEYRPDSGVQLVPQSEQRKWRHGIDRQVYFYNDWCSPRRNRATLEKCLRCLVEWTLRAIERGGSLEREPFLPRAVHEF